MSDSKKKKSGLAKKVPAIFEGVPEIQSAKEAKTVAAPQNESSNSAKAPVSGDIPQASPLTLLFQITDRSAEVIIRPTFEKSWDKSSSREYYFPSADQDNPHSDLSGFKKWLQQLQEDLGRKKISCEFLWNAGGIYAGQMERPSVDEKELKDSILWQVAEHVDFSIEPEFLHYREVGNQLLVGLVDAARLNPIMECMHEKQFYPTKVMLLPIAYQEFLNRNTIYLEEPVLLVHAADARTSLMVFHKGELVSYRETDFSGDLVAEAMMGKMMVDGQTVEVSYAEAQEIRESIGLPTKNLLPNPDEPKLSQLSARIRPVYERLASEVQRSIRVYEAAHPGEGLHSIILFGRDYDLKGVGEYIESQFKKKAETFKGESLSVDVPNTLCCYWGLEASQGKVLNFNSEMDQLRPKFIKWAVLCRKFCFGLGVLFVAFTLLSGIRLGIGKIQMMQASKEMDALGGTPQKIMKLDTQIKRNQNRRSLLQQNTKKASGLKEALLELSHIVPPALTLKEVSYSQEKASLIVFSGWVEMRGSNPDLFLTEFLDGLNGTHSFQSASLESRDTVTLNGREVVNFKIKATMVDKNG